MLLICEFLNGWTNELSCLDRNYHPGYLTSTVGVLSLYRLRNMQLYCKSFGLHGRNLKEYCFAESDVV